MLVLGHHDTVFPLGSLAQRPFRVSDGKATGPGVFDMKGGIVQAIHAVGALDDASGVEMLFTSDEEIGSDSSRALLEERALACGNVLVLEPSADGGAVKTGRKGTGTFEVVVRGRAAHAGLEPEKGVNVLVEAAYQVLTINTFGDPAAGTTVTPTVAHAGTADNVVPAEARVRVDVRVTGPDERARVESLMRALWPSLTGTEIEVHGDINRPPMPESASATLFPIASEVMPGLLGCRRRRRQRRQLHRRAGRADPRRPGSSRRRRPRRPRVRAHRDNAGESSPTGGHPPPPARLTPDMNELFVGWV